MPVKITYTCDRCGCTHDYGDQMYNVFMYVTKYPTYNPSEKPKAMWCSTCVIETKLLPDPRAPEFASLFQIVQESTSKLVPR